MIKKRLTKALTVRISHCKQSYIIISIELTVLLFMLNPKMSYLRYLKVKSKTLISFWISLWFLLVFAMQIPAD